MKNSISTHLNELLNSLSSIKDGTVAGYIPELLNVDPEYFGIALVTVDGQVHQVGDSQVSFSIQSISKAFTYGIALEDSGTELVRSKVDIEPSGEAFNSISLEPGTGRPRNPMINAGAIVSTSLVGGQTSEEKIARILKKYEQLSAKKLVVDDLIYRSERDTGHRNRAISHLLRNYDILNSDPEQPLDTYFKQCSILVTAEDLAVMGATLANKGVNPLSKTQAMSEHVVPSVLSVMASCGMYDYSGNWITSVGMPAKSGVGGGILAVLPGHFGLAVFSPRLDSKGNSVRGIRVCEAVSHDYSFHMFNSTRHTQNNTVKAIYTVRDVHSRLERNTDEALLIEKEGNKILVCELTGDQSFVSSEALTSKLRTQMKSRDTLILDFLRITGTDQASVRIFFELIRTLDSFQKKVILVGVRDYFNLDKYLNQNINIANIGQILKFDDLDKAIQHVETQLLEQHFEIPAQERRVVLAEQPICSGLDESQLNLLSCHVKRLTFQRGDVICKRGELPNIVYLVEKGMIDVVLGEGLNENGKGNQKIASYCGGAMIGEAAFFDRSIRRSANVIAVCDVDVLTFNPTELEAIDNNPLVDGILQIIYRNLAKLGFDRLRNANKVVMALTKESPI